MTTRYNVVLGGEVENEVTGEREYGQIGEAGPFRTRFGAWLAMRRRQGKPVREGEIEHIAGIPTGDRIVQGATVEKWDEDGTLHVWDYMQNGKLAEHYDYR